MKAMPCILVSFGMLVSAAVADNLRATAAASPEGWTVNSDGSYTHTQSGVVCTKIMGTYNFRRLDGPTEPNILGTCVYSGGDNCHNARISRVAVGPVNCVQKAANR